MVAKLSCNTFKLSIDSLCSTRIFILNLVELFLQLLLLILEFDYFWWNTLFKFLLLILVFNYLVLAHINDFEAGC